MDLHKKRCLTSPVHRPNLSLPTVLPPFEVNSPPPRISGLGARPRQRLRATTLVWINLVAVAIVINLAANQGLFHIGAIVERRTVEDQEVGVFPFLDAADPIGEAE